jgi:hypothetical protein
MLAVSPSSPASGWHDGKSVGGVSFSVTMVHDFLTSASARGKENSVDPFDLNVLLVCLTVMRHRCRISGYRSTISTSAFMIQNRR